MDAPTMQGQCLVLAGRDPSSRHGRAHQAPPTPRSWRMAAWRSTCWGSRDPRVLHEVAEALTPPPGARPGVGLQGWAWAGSSPVTPGIPMSQSAPEPRCRAQELPRVSELHPHRRAPWDKRGPQDKRRSPEHDGASTVPHPLQAHLGAQPGAAGPSGGVPASELPSFQQVSGCLGSVDPQDPLPASSRVPAGPWETDAQSSTQAAPPWSLLSMRLPTCSLSGGTVPCPPQPVPTPGRADHCSPSDGVVSSPSSCLLHPFLWARVASFGPGLPWEHTALVSPQCRAQDVQCPPIQHLSPPCPGRVLHPATIPQHSDEALGWDAEKMNQDGQRIGQTEDGRSSLGLVVTESGPTGQEGAKGKVPPCEAQARSEAQGRAARLLSNGSVLDGPVLLHCGETEAPSPQQGLPEPQPVPRVRLLGREQEVGAEGDVHPLDARASRPPPVLCRHLVAAARLRPPRHRGETWDPQRRPGRVTSSTWAGRPRGGRRGSLGGRAAMAQARTGAPGGQQRQPEVSAPIRARAPWPKPSPPPPAWGIQGEPEAVLHGSRPGPSLLGGPRALQPDAGPSPGVSRRPPQEVRELRGEQVQEGAHPQPPALPSPVTPKAGPPLSPRSTYSSDDGALAASPSPRPGGRSKESPDCPPVHVLPDGGSCPPPRPPQPRASQQEKAGPGAGAHLPHWTEPPPNPPGMSSSSLPILAGDSSERAGADSPQMVSPKGLQQPPNPQTLQEHVIPGRLRSFHR
ncbi:basic proline-rich protein-like [Choloepus didactylus]|uniref:basic proline-rich protein-like n=1 Tax=Choloepus didactylus TaxID=27675 RepID=UPI00189C841B|nr:basic proline-rich protein-like [Choloepus didactylus]